MDNLQSKNDKIRESRKRTREKRSHQVCRVFELKIDTSRLNKEQENSLNMMFIEAKWFRNNLLRQDDVFKYDAKSKNVIVLDKDKNEIQRELTLPATYRQSLLYQLQSNVKTLSTLKKKGYKVGKFRFRSEVNSIPLRDSKYVYRIIDENRIKLMGIKKPVIIRGLKQIPKDYEFANGHLLKRSNGFYIQVTTYQFPNKEKQQKSKGDKKQVGIDFGLKNTVTTSDGETFKVSVEESERLKRLQRSLSKKQKRSNNRNKVRKLLRVEHQKLTNRKKDLANKLVHYLLTNYDEVFIQDDNFRGWHKKFGRSVQHSCLGFIKVKLKASKKCKVIGQFEPTTKTCSKCGAQKKISLNERVYKCNCCDNVLDRDINAAINILNVGAGRTKLTPVKSKASAKRCFSQLPQALMLKQEDVKRR